MVKTIGAVFQKSPVAAVFVVFPFKPVAALLSALFLVVLPFDSDNFNCFGVGFVVYHTCISYCMHMVHTICVYAYGTTVVEYLNE